MTTTLFGTKELVLPQHGIGSDTYDSSLRRDSSGTVITTREDRDEARKHAIDDRRREGGDNVVNGLILTMVGLPTMVRHLRRGRTAGVQPPDGAASGTASGTTASSKEPGPD